MKQLLTLLFVISIFPFSWAQTSENDSINSPQKLRAMIGVDLFNPALSLFTEKQGAEAFVTVPYKKKWQIAGAVGYEQNIYDESGWDVDVQGLYARAGANWFISQDQNNPNMGFYIGGRLGYSNYQQTVNSYLIQGTDTPNATGSIPQHNASAFWLEPVMGARVQINETPFYIDASVHMKLLLSSSAVNNLDALVVPGFGRDVGGLNLGVKWGIAYALPF